MKKTMFTLFSVLVLCTACSKDDVVNPEVTDPSLTVDITNANPWETVNLNIITDLSRVLFITPDIGFIIGEAGKLFKTVDAGENWNEIPTGVSHNLESISFVNNKLIVNGLTSSDLGVTWSTQNSSEDYYTYQMTDNSILRGSISSFLGILERSTDSGLSWNTVHDIPTGYYHNSSFNNNGIGYLVTWYSGYVLKTTNFGETWTEVLSSFSNGILYDDFSDVKIISPEVVLVSGSQYITLSNDGGATFNIVYSNSNEVYFGIDSFDENQWIAVGKSGEIISTKDAGINWKTEQIGSSFFRDVTIGEKYIFVIGDNGTLLKKKIKE